MMLTLVYLLFGIGCAIRGWECYADDYPWYENVLSFIGVALLWPVIIAYLLTKRLDD